MVPGSVSGRKNTRKTAVKPDIHPNSQMGQLQPFAAAAKPPTIGPKTGPATAPIAHAPRAKGTYIGV
jgi:hypothetical protein